MRQARQKCHQKCDTDKLYITSNGLAFFSEQQATAYAMRLEDRTVATKTRKEVDKQLAKLAQACAEDEADKWLDELLPDRMLPVVRLMLEQTKESILNHGNNFQ